MVLSFIMDFGRWLSVLDAAARYLSEGDIHSNEDRTTGNGAVQVLSIHGSFSLLSD